ncbi:MAG TPA: NTP transferase domain-containing protein [Anaerolineae bacterium]|nr:NTP transferase domain-containing protein [Anaerolineae bacterium]HQK15319.1 NTP transferase domain-containing protein [Anaerolineae bacterium]
MTFISKDTERAARPLKAVILAAGQQPIMGDGVPIVLQTLGDRKIADYVIRNALRLVAPDDLYIVISQPLDEAQRCLWGVDAACPYHYIVQAEQRGTGHAVLQLAPFLKDFDGDLLILYGDTPLFRLNSIRGLLNRHRLKQAHLTLLSAVVDRPLPYGRIIRDAAGRIIDIIEETDASPEVREIRELNVGAYVAQARALFPALEKLPPSPVDGEYRLTDCAHRLIHAGMRVESYQIYDQDEVQGINNRADLDVATFILQKRLYRPRRTEEQNLIVFGTGGWRAIIGEGFTMHNVRRLSQALANEIIRRGQEKADAPHPGGVLIGYDRRFLSDRAAEAAAEVFAGNNIAVTLLGEDAPTPLITYATAKVNAAYGLGFTASHNPPEWNGLKVFRGDGSLLLDDETRQIEAEANRLQADDVVKIDLDLALEAGIVKRRDFTNEYVDAVEALIDLDAIREARLKVIVDPMYGVGQLTLGIILTEARCRVTFINERHDPLFGGRSPAPNLDALRMLVTHVRNEGYDLGLATDGDADRIAIVDEKGEYITVNDILLLLYWYLRAVRGERGGVVRNLATTHLLDRLAAHFGEACYETPVGFKHITAAMVAHNALLGGESSGGLTIRGHILGKDGIFAAALIVEMLARTGKKISQLLQQIYAITGRLYAEEDDIVATPEMRIVIPRRIKALTQEHAVTPVRLGKYPVVSISELDGTKFLLANDNWALLRFSGTEPLLRLFAEADSPEKAKELIESLKALISL